MSANRRGGYRYPQVPLVVGRNVIRLVVSNRDGPCLSEGRAEVSVAPAKLKPPPEVELLNRPQGAVKEPEFTAQFVVRSTGSRVRRVELRQESKVLVAVADPRQEADGQDRFEAKGDIGPVVAHEGPNRFRLVAVNDGGEAEEAFIVSHVPIPEWLEIDPPNVLAAAGRIPTDRAGAVGRLRAGGGCPTKGAGAAGIREQCVPAADALLSPGRGEPPGVSRSPSSSTDRRRTWSRWSVRTCGRTRGDGKDSTVDCARPKEQPRTLHLLVVAIGPGRVDVTDKTLALRALKALHAHGAGRRAPEHRLRSGYDAPV